MVLGFGIQPEVASRTGQCGDRLGQSACSDLASPALPSSGQKQECRERGIPRLRFREAICGLIEEVGGRSPMEWLPQMETGKTGNEGFEIQIHY